ncbi:MAG: hypothetical protein ACI8S6_000492 [Myxococcota bacterium]
MRYTVGMCRLPMMLCLLLAACDRTQPPTDDVPPGEVYVFPVVHNFGELRLGTELGSSFAITNNGEGPLQVFDVAFADDTRRPHWQLRGGRSGILEPGDSTRLEVLARPLDLTNPSVDLIVQTDDPNSPEVTVSLSILPRGLPEIRIEPAQINFGAVSIGASVSAQLQIFNDGVESLQIYSAELVGSASSFSLSVNPTGGEIDPERDDGLIEVVFTPRLNGIVTDQVVVRSDDPDTPEVSVLITGQGVP